MEGFRLTISPQRIRTFPSEGDATDRQTTLLFSVQVDKLEVVNKKWVRVQLLPGAPDSTVTDRKNLLIYQGEMCSSFLAYPVVRHWIGGLLRAQSRKCSNGKRDRRRRLCSRSVQDRSGCRYIDECSVLAFAHRLLRLAVSTRWLSDGSDGWWRRQRSGWNVRDGKYHRSHCQRECWYIIQVSEPFE